MSSSSAFGNRHLSLHMIIDDRVTSARCFQADCGSDPRGGIGWVPVPPGAIVAPYAALILRLCPGTLQFLRCHVTAVGVAGIKQGLGHLPVAGRTLELKDGISIPVDSEPVEGIEDGLDRLPCRPLAVRVLDAQPERTVPVAGVKPVEQCRAGTANMEGPRRRRGKSCHNAHEGISTDATGPPDDPGS